MELNREQERRIQNLIDKCNKVDDDGLDIYEMMDTYKCYQDESEELRDYIYEVVADSLGVGEYTPTIYGYARVSTKSQEDNTSLENQINILKSNGCTKIYNEVATGATMDRIEFNKLECKLRRGDTLIITKLDRFTRSTEKGISKIKELAEKGIKVNILNMGIVDLSSAMGKMMFTVLSAFAEYEKDCIVERMKEGKQLAKQDPKFKEGRPKVYNDTKKEHALELLNSGKTYKEVEQLTGISKSTLIRYKRSIMFKEMEKQQIKKCLSNKEVIENELGKVGLTLRCYDEKINELSTIQLKQLLIELQNESTDIHVEINKKEYVIEINTIDNEKDITILDLNEYTDRYGCID